MTDKTSAEWWDNFRTLLDDQNDWPTLYLFKFIAPKENAPELQEVFAGHEVMIRASSKGSYHSITTRVLVDSAEQVIDYYRKASEIEGVISL